MVGSLVLQDKLPYSKFPEERWQSSVDCARLEIVYAFGHRGFESPPLRV